MAKKNPAPLHHYEFFLAVHEDTDLKDVKDTCTMHSTSEEAYAEAAGMIEDGPVLVFSVQRLARMSN